MKRVQHPNPLRLFVKETSGSFKSEGLEHPSRRCHRCRPRETPSCMYPSDFRKTLKYVVLMVDRRQRKLSPPRPVSHKTSSAMRVALTAGDGEACSALTMGCFAECRKDGGERRNIDHLLRRHLILHISSGPYPAR